MNKSALVISLSLIALSSSAWANPSRIHKTWLAARSVVLHPRDSYNTLRNAQRVLHRRVRFGEKVSILAAHNTGVGQRNAQTGQLQWQPGVIAKKARILRSSTLAPAERKKLFKASVVGKFTIVTKGYSQDPMTYGGVLYPSAYAAREAMAKYWRVPVSEIDIVPLHSPGYRSFGPQTR